MIQGDDGYGISKRNLKYFNLAKSVSQLSDYKHQHIGCVVVLGKHVISVGYNTNRTHPIQMYYNQYRDLYGDHIEHKLHAECYALGRIRHLDIDWSKVEIYIYREHKNTGVRALAAPCPACMTFIRELGIKDIFYTGNDSWVHERVG